MAVAPRYLEFAPPPTPGLWRAMALAVLAHGLLLALLSAGVHWKRDPVQAAVEAELWSAVPVQAAPPAPEPDPPAPEPEPPKPLPPKPAPPPKPSAAELKAQADIALAREKEKEKARLKEKQAALEKEKLAKQKQEAEKKKQAELEQQKRAKQEEERKAREKQEQAAKAKEEQRRKQDEAAAARARDEQLKRVERLASGATGGGSTPGGAAAAQSSGPSAGYAGRIVARIKPNITFPDNIDGNPRVEVEIRTSPSGAILSARITQSSGVKSWDEAVTRAIYKTEQLPKDIDGTVPSSLLIGFRPKD